MSKNMNRTSERLKIMKEEGCDEYMANDILNSRNDIVRLGNRNKILREGLEKIRDCNFVITPADRMDAVRKIAKEHLEEELKEEDKI